MRAWLCALVFASAPALAADSLPLLHPLFSDHAVVQRGRPIPVWGWAAPGELVQVTFANASISARASDTGRWEAQLPAMDAGGPYELTVQAASGATQHARDVLVGEVWLCSGQSNMVLEVHRTLNARAEIADANNDSIRMLTVGQAESYTPLQVFEAPVHWLPATSAHVAEFSATCYYFARELQQPVKVPMGLITTAWGGSNIQTWMSRDAVRATGYYDELLALLDLSESDPPAARRRWGTFWESWWKSHVPTKSGDEPWSAAPLREQQWHVVPSLTEAWEKWGVPELASFNGMVWYRTTFKLSSKQARQRARLSLGPVDEVDNTWLNGMAVGYTSDWATDREYEIPPRLLRAGDNVLVINALDTYGSGGIYGPAEKRVLRLGDGSMVALDGAWHYQVAPAIPGRAPRAPWEPVRGLTVIHNAMIAPLVPYGLKGVLWYQGESITDDPDRYQRLLSGLMSDWRGKFGAELPFLVVQLANYGPVATQPGESGWAGVRAAQRAAVAQDTHAGLAVTIDIGDPYDIHPTNKQEVGRRLARAARHVVYGESLAPSGPVARSAHIEDGRVVVEFADVEGQLLAHGADVVIGFELCGAEAETCRYITGTPDRNRVWLDPGATTPARVRYGWADSPVCTLFDLAGLPAGPFELPITSR